MIIKKDGETPHEDVKKKKKSAREVRERELCIWLRKWVGSVAAHPARGRMFQTPFEKLKRDCEIVKPLSSTTPFDVLGE